MKRKMSNPILDEIRRIRETMFEEAGGTMDGIVKLIQSDIKRIAEKSISVSRPKKRKKTEKA